jgi:CheY-like chemotaxis protein
MGDAAGLVRRRPDFRLRPPGLTRLSAALLSRLRRTLYTVQQYYRPGGILVSRGLVLVIEDDQDIRDLLTLILTRMGFEVHAVATGTHGVAAAREHHPVLVTMDLNLPDMDGLDVARYIRTRSEAPMLLVTTRAEADDEMAGRASGPSAYLTKPFGPRQLTEAVNKLCPIGPLTAHSLEPRS